MTDARIFPVGCHVRTRGALPRGSSKRCTHGDVQGLGSMTMGSYPHRERPSRQITLGRRKGHGHSRRPRRKHSPAVSRSYGSDPGGVIDPPRRTLAIMQVSHSGRQSANWVSGRLPWNPSLAPSFVRVGTRELGFFPQLVYRLLFSTPREISVPEIDQLVDRLVLSVKVAHQAGFGGVELHAGHGCV